MADGLWLGSACAPRQGVCEATQQAGHCGGAVPARRPRRGQPHSPIRPFQVTFRKRNSIDLRQRIAATVADGRLSDRPRARSWRRAGSYVWDELHCEGEAKLKLSRSRDEMRRARHYFIHVRSRHRNAASGIITRWPGPVVELLNLSATHESTALRGQRRDAFDVVIPSCRLRLLGKADRTGWDPPHRTNLGGADEARCYTR